MKYIHSLKGTGYALPFIIIATFLIKGVGPSNDVELLLTVTTFLFAILVGFFMSRVNDRYNKMRELIAEEDALWLSFYKNASAFGKAFTQRIVDLIDKYYVIAYDFTSYSSHYYKQNAKFFLKIFDELHVISKKRSQGAYDYLYELLTTLEVKRNKASVLSLEKIHPGQWSVLYILAGIIIYCLFYLKTPLIHSHIITMMLVSAILLIILIMRDLQNTRMYGQIMLLESGQEVFEFIGKLRYYNHVHIDDGSIKIPEHVKEYRVGMHNPGDEELKIKIVKRE